MLTTEQLTQFFIDVADYHTFYDSVKMRAGQAMYNVLNTTYPEIAKQINGSETLDPYYNDNNIPNFLAFLIGQ
ncbi:MAG TPA: hypothetical protein PKU78_06415 [Candidatus Dojkabacteria bacterium]|nr:hypothetical protein [Candidatus Dojkabacteria bacterium]